MCLLLWEAYAIVSITGLALFGSNTILKLIGGDSIDTTTYIITSLLVIPFVIVSGLLLLNEEPSFYFICVDKNFDNIIKNALDNLSIKHERISFGYGANNMTASLHGMFGLAGVINLSKGKDINILNQISREFDRIYKTENIKPGLFFWMNLARIIIPGVFIIAIGIIFLAVSI